MADGAIIGRRAAIGQVVPGDASQTVVTGAEITLPSADGRYCAMARFGGGSTNTLAGLAGIVIAGVHVEAGAAYLGAGASEIHNVGSTGIVCGMSVSGLSLRATVTDASGKRCVALLELFGVEMDLAAA